MDLESRNKRSCLIIGAGIAGLCAAHILRDTGFSVLVVDKGRGVGGRMATRRFGAGVFDHGAQFITVRHPKFGTVMGQWREMGAAALWAAGFASTSSKSTDGGHARYRGHPAMTAIPKILAAGLDIRLGVRVTSVAVDGKRWRAHTDGADAFEAETLILTPPVPQSLALLDSGNSKLPAAIDAQLRSIAYHPCIALLALFDEPTDIPRPGGLTVDGGPIRWIADNQQKGISPDAVSVTIHGASDFSRLHWDSSDEVIASQLLLAATRWLPQYVRGWQVHRWRYSQPVETDPATCASIESFAPGPPLLAFAGDAFAGGRVEGAAISGWRAADYIAHS